MASGAELQLYELSCLRDTGATFFEEYLHYSIFSMDNPVTPPPTPPPEPSPPPTPTPPPTPPPPTPSPPPTPVPPRPRAILPQVLVAGLQFAAVPPAIFGLADITMLGTSVR